MADDLDQLIAESAAAASRVRSLFLGRQHRASGQEALEGLQRLVTWATTDRVEAYLDQAGGWIGPTDEDRAGSWQDFERRPDHFYRELAPALGANPGNGSFLRAEDVRRATELARLAGPLAHATQQARDAVVPAFHALRSAMVKRDLAQMPISSLKDATTGRLRFGRIESAGFATVQSVLNAGVWRLRAIDGVGDASASQVFAAAQQVAAAVEEHLSFRIDLDPRDPLGTRLIVALHRWGLLHDALAGLDEDLAAIASELHALAETRPPEQGWVGFFSGRSTGSLTPRVITAWLDWADSRSVWPRLLSAQAVAAQAVSDPMPAWDDFKRRPSDYYSLLGLLVDLKTDAAAAEGYLPEDIVARVHAQPLDGSLARVSLRGYQSFGARFALVQDRVVIGDEMGLGKTIQALAVMAHLKAMGSTHFLVVCPASVVINWTREIRGRSRLVAYQLHGFERSSQQRRWLARGDVAVTTFESLRHVNIPNGLDIALLVVDEAHYVKNPTAQRSQRVASLATRAQRVLFLTGTPMENRVEEFVSLLDCLQPDAMPQLGRVS